MTSSKPGLRDRLSRRYARAGQLRRDVIAGFWAIVGVLGFVLTYNLVHTPDGPQHWSADRITGWCSTREASQDRRIALIYLTTATLKSLPYSSPVDRGVLAEVVAAADAAGALAIGLDFVLDRQTETAKDDALAAAIRDARAPVVTGVLDERSPPGSFDRQWQDDFLKRSGFPSPRLAVGHLYFDEPRNRLIISDHVIRAIASPTSLVTYKVSFAEALAKAGGSSGLLKTPQISWLLPPTDGSETFLTLSAEDVIGKGELRAALPLKELLDRRIVIIGGNFADRDQHFTPLSVGADTQYPGASVHAQVVAQILDGRALYAPSRRVEIAIGLVVTALGFWIGRREMANRYHRAVEFAAATGLVLTTIGCFLVLNFLFPFTLVFFWGMMGIVAGHYSTGIDT